MANQRRETILSMLQKSETPVSATSLAQTLGVTRQVIVGDVALLRASGHEIIATPRGYVVEKKENYSYVIACEHTPERLLEELLVIIHCGCGIINVIVEHAVYGQITGNLHIFTQSEAEEFVRVMNETDCKPLSEITQNIHLHTLHCPSEVHFQNVVSALREKGFLPNTSLEVPCEETL